ADDGIIEAFEKPNHPFCIGVQWHPEYQISTSDQKLYEEFVKQASNYKKNKFNHG
ncbi:MAG: gamma-glutamyl-gamma-aminobutyrate hydrolase family protein, partial [Alphaproteobacteria bacterium]